MEHVQQRDRFTQCTLCVKPRKTLFGYLVDWKDLSDDVSRVWGGFPFQLVEHAVVTCCTMLGHFSPLCGVIAFRSQALLIIKVIK